MNYKNYIIEIKNRLILISCSWLFTILICYIKKELILYILIKPCLHLYKESILYFIYTHLSDIFYTYVNIIIIASIQITIFYILYQSYHFLAPGLYKSEIKRIKLSIISLFIIWAFTIILLHNIILPFSWKFFLSFQNNISETNNFSFFFEAKLDEYISFVIASFNICLFNLLCVYCIITILHNKSGISNSLKTYRKIIYFILFLLASIVTPPDIVSQLFLGTLSLLLFEIYNILSIINIKLRLRKPIKTN